MDFGIGMEIDKEASKSSYYVHSFVDRLSEFIRTRYYGSGIEHFTIGLVVIRSSLGYEDWFKQRKPRFQKVQKLQVPGQTVTELHNCYKLFCQKFTSSLVNFESPSMKSRDFDLCAFKEDVQGFIDSWEFA